MGENFELILMLRMNRRIAGLDKGEVSKLYIEALEWVDDRYDDMTLGEIKF